MKKDYGAPKNKGDKRQEITQEAHVAGDVLQYALIISLENTSDYWVVDSWDSCHATPHRKFFHDYVQGYFGDVLLGGDEPCKIVGMGKVHMKLNNGNEWMLKDVRNIPSMKINLISIGKLGDNVCLSMFGKMWWKITKGTLIITKGDRKGVLYLCLHNTIYSIFVAST